LQEVRIGPLGYRLGEAMYQAAAGISDAGIHVVMDDVIWTRRMLATAVANSQPAAFKKLQQ